MSGIRGNIQLWFAAFQSFFVCCFPNVSHSISLQPTRARSAFRRVVPCSAYRARGLVMRSSDRGEGLAAAPGNNLVIRLKTEENQEDLCSAGRLQYFLAAYWLLGRENTERRLKVSVKLVLSLCCYNNALVTPVDCFWKGWHKKKFRERYIFSEIIFERMGRRSDHPCGTKARMKRFTKVLNAFSLFLRPVTKV
jgi:hypothetical protein